MLETISFESVLDFVFGGSTSDVLFIKIGLLLVIFAVMFWALERALHMTRGQAAVVAFIVGALSMHFTPNQWVMDFGTWIWVLVLFVVPYFLIRALTSPGFVRWVLVGLTYFGLLFTLANYGSYFGDSEVSGIVSPIIEVLSPILFLVTDMWRLSGNNYLYLLIGIIVVVLFFAFRKSKVPEEKQKVVKVEQAKEKKGSFLWKLLFGSGKKVAKGTAKYLGSDAKRTWRLWSHKCMYCGRPLIPGAVSCPSCGKDYTWRQRRWSKRQVKVVKGESSWP
ncbi:MAG: zinc ribbon domain-containing protein [archaeon]